MAAQLLVATLAGLVAIQYGFIGVYIVPRLARLAACCGSSAVRAAQWGGAIFFVGCGLTHVGIGIHTLTGPTLEAAHLLTVHAWPHLAQIAGGATFSWVVWRRLEVSLAPKGFEEERARTQAERERDSRLLAQRAAEQAAVADLGRRALETSDPQELFQETTRVLRSTLGVDFCNVLELLPGGERLRLIAGMRWEPGSLGEVWVPADAGSLAGFTLTSRRPVIVGDIENDSRFTHPVLRAAGVVSTMTAVIGGRPAPFGVLAVHSRTQRDFTSQDAHCLEAVANILATALERAASERASRHRSLHDALTGLPNRVLLLDRLELSLQRLKRSPGTIGVLFFDVDDFKTINDTFGHPAGDELLASIATRLRGVLRASETLARFGGDEFALLCDDLRGPHDAEAVARRVAEALGRPFLIHGHELFVSSSIGIALTGDCSACPEELLRDADVAMYRAKGGGRGRIEVFDETLRESVLDRLRTESALRGALERGEMSLLYQPQVSLEDGSLTGVEALLRWDHPERGVISPGDFVPLAEQTGLIVPIGTWVLREACRQAAAWRDRHGGAPLKVSVNVSAHQLSQPDFVALVRDTLEATGARPEELAIEITESLLMQISGSPVEMLEGLRQLGVDIQLDDFGTGYSSLGYIESLPLDALKMDRAFVAGLADKPASREIFSAVLTMADALELAVVAEGVEGEDQADRLRQLGCPRAQGYLFGRPAPPEEIDDLLAAAGAGPEPAAAG